jgi:competence ComEA-like helix-hairpin-helix protein
MRYRRLVLPIIFSLLPAPLSPAKKKSPTQPININTANSSQLQLVPGIGPATANKILQMRKSYGAFKSVNDLMAIRGIGPKRLEKMKKYLTVAGSKNRTPPANCAGCIKPKPRPPTKPLTTQLKEPPSQPKPGRANYRRIRREGRTSLTPVLTDL